MTEEKHVEIAIPAPNCAMGERLHALNLARRAGAPASGVLWHAGVREGRQDGLLLPRGPEMYDVRLHPGDEPHARGGRLTG